MSRRIRRNTPCGEMALEARRRVYQQVVERDGGKCQSCGGPGQEVHEICSRWMFSSRTMASCMVLRNMVCLCRKCHAEAATRERRTAMLLRLARLHGYDYSDPPWNEYVEAQ